MNFAVTVIKNSIIRVLIVRHSCVAVLSPVILVTATQV